MAKDVKPHPIRLQRSRQHKLISPNGLPIVYVGRGRYGDTNYGKHGNPFKAGDIVKIGEGGNGFMYIKAAEKKYADDTFETVRDNSHAVELYKKYLSRYPLTEKTIRELRGKNLSCWCKVGEPCHADVLLELVNKP